MSFLMHTLKLLRVEKVCLSERIVDVWNTLTGCGVFVICLSAG